jgi:hypothetical protein
MREPYLRHSAQERRVPFLRLFGLSTAPIVGSIPRAGMLEAIAQQDDGSVREASKPDHSAY